MHLNEHETYNRKINLKFGFSTIFDLCEYKSETFRRKWKSPYRYVYKIAKKRQKVIRMTIQTEMLKLKLKRKHIRWFRKTHMSLGKFFSIFYYYTHENKPITKKWKDKSRIAKEKNPKSIEIEEKYINPKVLWLSLYLRFVVIWTLWDPG